MSKNPIYTQVPRCEQRRFDALQAGDILYTQGSAGAYYWAQVTRTVRHGFTVHLDITIYHCGDDDLHDDPVECSTSGHVMSTTQVMTGYDRVRVA